MSTITGTITQTVTLGPGAYPNYASPLTITSTGTVTVTGANDAVLGNNALQTGTVFNQGHVIGVGANADGVVLRGGGSIANTGAGLIRGFEAIYIGGIGAQYASSFGAVYNSATIQGTLASAIDFREGGSVDNTGIIQGQSSGVLVATGFGTVTNSGTIDGTAANAVYLASGGTVTNTGAGQLVGKYYGVKVSGAAGTVTNSATIEGTGPNSRGVALFSGGSVANTGGGLIQGLYHGVEVYGGVVSNSGTIIATTNGAGVELPTGGTVIDSGTISGTNYAVQFHGAGTDRLVLGPGYDLIAGFEKVTASSLGTNTLELASAASAGTVTSPLATQFVNFSTITVDAGAQWTLNDAITVAAPTILNAGTLIGPGASGDGVSLTSGGSVGNTGSIGGYSGVYIAGAAGTVTNSGTIDGTGVNAAATPAPAAIYLKAAGGIVINSGVIESSSNVWTVNFASSGYLSNSSSGYIGAGGVTFGNGGTVVNHGTIKDTGGAGVVMAGAYGTVTNSGTIAGAGGTSGIVLAHGGSISNTGLITDAVGGGYGVLIETFAGTVTNSGAIIGTSGFGIELGAGGTVVDSGTISGIGDAVKFLGSGNLLVLEHGYFLSGALYGGSGPTNTLELSGALGTVTVNYNGRPLSNFQDVLFGGAGSETLQITNDTTLPGTISGFTLTSETIDLTTLAGGTITNPGGTVNGSDQLIISNGVGTVTLQLDASEATTVFRTATGTGTVITPACFCRGTLMWTARGEVAVEDLAIGDRLITLSGAARAIKWIGRRAYDGRFVAANRMVLPIRVAAGALAPGVPARDLFLSPEHALYIDGALVPAGQLVNGASVRQVESIDRLEYFHIELETHDVILAEGAPAETYVDCDNRFMFQNGAEFALLYPDDLPAPWDFCAPRAEEGSAELAAIRAALRERAEALGYRSGDAADLRRIAGGGNPRGQSVAAEAYNLTIPAGARALAVASRSVAPAGGELAA